MSTANMIKDGDYKVADISLAEWGRKELTIAERANYIKAEISPNVPSTKTENLRFNT